MLKCEICGCEFNAQIEKHYISRDEGKTGLGAISGGSEVIEYDTFDCPQCGCQHVVQKRKRTVNDDLYDGRNEAEEGDENGEKNP